MPIDGDFSLQIDVATGPMNPPEQSEGLFAFDQCQEYLMPNQSYLVRNPRNGKYGMLTPDVFGAMSECTRFRSMEGHVQHLMESNPALQGHAADVKKVLETVQNDGLTISGAEVCARLPVNSAAVLQDDLPVVAITTWERPECLQRLLESMEQNYGNNRTSPCYVIDDSRTDKNITRNEEVVDSFRQNGWESLVYLGPEQLSNLVNSLLKQLPQSERGIRFLFDRDKWAGYHSCGLARNYALLVSAGKRLVIFDDDVLCDVYEPISSRPGIELGDNQREADFYSDISEFEQFRAKENHDVVLRHSQCLGMNLGDALGTLEIESVHESCLATTKPGTVEHMSSDSPVLITVSGWYGDHGSGNSRWIGKVGKESRERLLQSEDKLISALTVRMAWLGRERPQIQSRLNMSPITALDNRVVLSPYFPVFRWEDALFGKMVEFIFPKSVCLEYPWAIIHLPAEDRSCTIEDIDFYLEERFPRFFQYYIEWQKSFCGAEDPGERMTHLANLIRELGQRSSESLMDLNKDSKIGMLTKHMQFLIKAQSDSADGPALWQRLTSEAINRASSDIIKIIGEETVTGFPTGLENDELLQFWQRAWQDFADSIQAWPMIREAAPMAMQECGLNSTLN